MAGDWDTSTDTQEHEFDDYDPGCDECGAVDGHDLAGCPLEWECCFPDSCIMADPDHHRSECATAEMMEAYYADYDQTHERKTPQGD